MAVSPEVIELVQLLDGEGFGMLAGELLTEIALGRETDEESATEDVGGAAQTTLAEPLRFADVPPPRQPIPEGEQLAFAAEFLRLRLVEPILRLAEAEDIAGALALEGLNQGEDVRKATATDPVRIKFTRPEGDDRPPLDRTEPPGRADTALALSEVLEQLARSGTEDGDSSSD